MPSQASARASDRTVATNRRARHDYEVLETVEAGLVLRGTEVKSLRAGQVTFKDSYATMRNEEAWLVGCHISPYSHGSDANHDPERDRKLLLRRREITRLVGKTAERGLTLVPLRLYLGAVARRSSSAWRAAGSFTTSGRPFGSARSGARWTRPREPAGGASGEPRGLQRRGRQVSTGISEAQAASRGFSPLVK